MFYLVNYQFDLSRIVTKTSAMNNTKTKSSSNKQKRQLASNLLFVHEDLQQIINKQEPLHQLTYRDRVYPPQITLQLFIEQALNPTQSCDSIVQFYANKMYLEQGAILSINSGGYCKARNKLSEHFVDAVF